MGQTIIFGGAIVSLVDVDFKCPACGCPHTEDDYRKHLKKHGEIPDGESVEFNDDNCYGTHEVTIQPDLA